MMRIVSVRYFPVHQSFALINTEYSGCKWKAWLLATTHDIAFLKQMDAGIGAVDMDLAPDKENERDNEILKQLKH